VTVSPALDLRFREAALAEGVLDLAYDIADTPTGPLFVGVTDCGLARISFDPDPAAELERIAELAGPRVLRSTRAGDRSTRGPASTSTAGATRSTSRSTCAA